MIINSNANPMVAKTALRDAVETVRWPLSHGESSVLSTRMSRTASEVDLRCTTKSFEDSLISDALCLIGECQKERTDETRGVDVRCKRGVRENRKHRRGWCCVYIFCENLLQTSTKSRKAKFSVNHTFASANKAECCF